MHVFVFPLLICLHARCCEPSRLQTEGDLTLHIASLVVGKVVEGGVGIVGSECWVVFPLCGLRKLENRTFVVHLREVFHPRTQMGNFPQGASRLLVIVPDHFHIPNYFNQSFSHMNSFLSLAYSHPLFLL